MMSFSCCNCRWSVCGQAQRSASWNSDSNIRDWKKWPRAAMAAYFDRAEKIKKYSWLQVFGIFAMIGGGVRLCTRCAAVELRRPTPA
jgi:hypothetical protein